MGTVFPSDAHYVSDKGSTPFGATIRYFTQAFFSGGGISLGFLFWETFGGRLKDWKYPYSVLYCLHMTRVPPNKKYTYEYFAPIVEGSTTWKEVAQKVGVGDYGGMAHYLRQKAIELGIDHSHFLGRAGAMELARATRTRRTPPIEELYESTTVPSHKFRNRLFRDGVKQFKCEECGITEWNDRPAPLTLDHIDGNHKNNHLENLKILCANCHGLKTADERYAVKKNRCRDCNRVMSQSRGTNRCWECWTASGEQKEIAKQTWLRKKKEIADARSEEWPSPEGMVILVQEFGWKELGKRYRAGVLTLKKYVEGAGIDISTIQKIKIPPLNEIATEEILDKVRSSSWKATAQYYGTNRKSLVDWMRDRGVNTDEVFSKNWTVGKARNQITSPGSTVGCAGDS